MMTEEAVTSTPTESVVEPKVVVQRMPPPMKAIEPTADTDTHPLVRAAIQSGPIDPTTLRELMALQREWEAGEAKKSYTRAMVDMKRELPTVLNRDKTVDFASKSGRTTYTHISLAAAVEAVTGPMCAHGFSVSFQTRIGERNTVEVSCELTHRDGHSESCTLAAPPETSGTKNPVQAVASTVTLLERYTMLALLGIATKDHADPQPQSAGSAEAPKSVDDIISMFVNAKNPNDVSNATAAWTAIKYTLTEDDRDQLKIEREEAIKRLRGDA